VSATPRWLVVLRDVVLLLVGVFGILHQEITGQANPLLLGVYTTLLGIPGATSALALLKGTGSGGTTPSEPPSQPQEQESPLP
jgi:uncharacterized membrane protein HdeD (DUF308 family)